MNFRKKFQQICKRSKENFLTKMYRGQFVIAALPLFTRHEYHKDGLEEIATTIEELYQSYEEGRSFLRDLKIVIAQIAAKDWTPVDEKRIAMKIHLVRKHMATAVKAGCLLSNGSLVNFDTEEEICDGPVDVAGMEFRIADTRLELAASEGSTNTTTETILGSLRETFEQVVKRRGIKDDEWHAKLEKFLQALAERRHQRVHKWVDCNTCEFSESNEVQKLQLEVRLALAQVKQEMAICGGKCSVCFWRCVLNKGHFTASHSCMGSHSCTEKCSYCSKEYSDDNEQAEVLECQSLAGHEGHHDCKEKNHTCKKSCTFAGSSSNCNKECSQKAGHEGVHRCNTPQHICNNKCSLPGCQNLCVSQIETGSHQEHKCHERYCPNKCAMTGCARSCGIQDHFHQLKSNQHLCGNEHPCPEKCQAEGICRISTKLYRQTRSFPGIRGSFDYEEVPEQNGEREECCIPVPPFQEHHEGAHVHTQDPNCVHSCGVKCQACGYCCDLPIKHTGLHNTVHGNMRNVKFSSDTEEFEIQNRGYFWGESGKAEMCNMHCRALGRGHVHLINCPNTGTGTGTGTGSDGNDTNSSRSCLGLILDGARHQTKEYGPDKKVPKDELTHKAYWHQMRFQDPCSEEDRQQFELCNHFCTSDEHQDKDGNRKRSYCTQKLWHEPVNSAPDDDSHVTLDGHVFTCKHWHSSPHHVIFVVDRSGSMASSDEKPQIEKFQKSHNCRLGCVYEAMVRFIATRRKTMLSGDIMSVVLFDDTAQVGVQTVPLQEDFVDALMCRYSPGGCTSYSAGLNQTRQVLVHGFLHPNYSNLTPVVIFLSDGGNTDDSSDPDPVSLVENILKTDPRCVVNTVMFGTYVVEILERMADKGKGKFYLSNHREQLYKNFESLAYSLEPGTASLH